MKIGSYDEIKKLIQDMPQTWYPSLLVEMVESAIAKKVFVPGGATRIVAKVEEKAIPRASRPESFKLVAVHDGCGESACWGIYVEYDGEIVADLPWPKDWPVTVSSDFLEQNGFQTITA